MNLTPGSIYS
jgi:hypothetical protein